MRKSWMLVFAGIGICVVIVGGAIVAFGAWFWSQKVQTAAVGATAASDRFETARRQFSSRTPFIAVDREHLGELVCTRAGEPGALSTIHVMVFEGREGRLVDVDIPYWLARLKSVPVQVGSTSLFDSNSRFTIEDLERCGPGLVLDMTGRHGEQVLVWQR